MKYLKTFERYEFGREEFVEIINPINNARTAAKAKIDTETYTSNIDSELATKLGLVPEVELKRVYNYLGDQNLPVAKLDLVFNTGELKGRRLNTEVTISDRSKLDHKIAIGRRDLKELDILIDVNKSI